LSISDRPLPSDNAHPSRVGLTRAGASRPIGATTDLGLIVRERRRVLALTQQELADAAGTGRRFVSELEAGKVTLEFGKILRVCQLLGIDLFAKAR